MTLIIQKPSGAKLVFAQTNNGITDPEAIIYISNVEQADGQPLEYATAKAIHDFVAGCKADGIWNAIKASCILAGARTLSGALVPLVGTAPTNFNFVAGDYNRKTGLGNPTNTTKYVDSNRNANAQAQNNFHFSVFATDAGSTSTYRAHISTSFSGNSDSDLSDILALNDNRLIFRNRNGNGEVNNNIINAPAGSTINFMGTNRNNASSFSFRRNSTTANVTTGFSAISYAPIDSKIAIFARPSSPPIFYSNARLAFYSIGESLDLDKLDTRVSALITAIGAAIP